MSMAELRATASGGTGGQGLRLAEVHVLDGLLLGRERGRRHREMARRRGGELGQARPYGRAGHLQIARVHVGVAVAREELPAPGHRGESLHAVEVVRALLPGRVTPGGGIVAGREGVLEEMDRDALGEQRTPGEVGALRRRCPGEPGGEPQRELVVLDVDGRGVDVHAGRDGATHVDVDGLLLLHRKPRHQEMGVVAGGAREVGRVHVLQGEVRLVPGVGPARLVLCGGEPPLRPFGHPGHLLPPLLPLGHGAQLRRRAGMVAPERRVGREVDADLLPPAEGSRGSGVVVDEHGTELRPGFGLERGPQFLQGLSVLRWQRSDALHRDVAMLGPDPRLGLRGPGEREQDGWGTEQAHRPLPRGA